MDWMFKLLACRQRPTYLTESVGMYSVVLEIALNVPLLFGALVGLPKGRTLPSF